jgi:hypothetical protein
MIPCNVDGHAIGIFELSFGEVHYESSVKNLNGLESGIGRIHIPAPVSCNTIWAATGSKTKRFVGAPLVARQVSNGEDTRASRRYVDLGVPSALAFDSTGNLYVADSKRSDVYVYEHDSRTLLRRLTEDVNKPLALLVGEGNVYVGNKGDVVTVYPIGSKKLS